MSDAATVGKYTLSLHDALPISGADVSDFIQNIATGKAFPLLRLEGVVSTGGGTETVYDLRLSGEFATKVSDTNGTVHREVVYKAVSLTTTEQDPKGGPSTSETV